MDATGQGESLDVVRPWDPAVRWSDGHAPEDTNLAGYMRGREWASLRIVEGARPMVFHTRRLRRVEMRDVECLHGEPLRHEAAFACGVVSVTMPDGSSRRPASGRWTLEELEAFDFATVEDVGSVVLARSRVPFGLRLAFAGPPSSRAASAAYLFPYAAQSPADAVPSKSAPEASSGG